MTGSYAYYANGLIESVTYGNGNNASSTSYTYDDANRLVAIEHLDGSTTLLKLDYTYTPNSLPDTITEYDARGRLIYERREDYVDDNPDYDLTYEYDQGGNRTKKTDFVNDRQIVFHYDNDDVPRFGTYNNRLEYYETFDTGATPAVLLSTIYYYYWCNGNRNQIVTHVEGTQDYSAVRFEYARNGTAVTHVLGEAERPNGPYCC